MPKNGDYRITTQQQKDSFAKHIGVDPFVIDKIDTITNLGLSGQTDLIANDEEKYIGRFYYNNEVWFGLLGACCKKICLAFSEEYTLSPKTVSETLQNNRINYIAVDTSIDNSYWLYIDLTVYLLDEQELKKKIEHILGLIKQQEKRGANEKSDQSAQK